MIFGQEDYNAAVQDDNHRTLDYISKHIDEWEHEGCVFLRLMDGSGEAEEWWIKRHPNYDYPECSVEVLVTPEEMKEIRKIMLKLLKKAEERMVMSLLERTIENTPMNEAKIRGMNTQTVTSSDLSRMQAVLFLSMLKANNGADFVAVVKLNDNGRYDITVPEGIIYA